jgi:hypothetical protein
MMLCPADHKNELSMTIAAGNFIITIEEIKQLGKAWVVRVSRKRLLGGKRISSDWFLDEEQAQNFARELEGKLKGSNESGFIKDRKPGWTLVQPAH